MQGGAIRDGDGAGDGARPVQGIIEGFYGRPWSWDERAEVMAWCHERGMTHYVYAPKDDPRHRHEWRDPYPADELDRFAGLVAAGTLEVGFAISPGLTMAYDDPADRGALAAKVDQLVDAGIDLVCLALDDIPVRPGLGEEHARVTAWLADHLVGRARVVLVPTEYAGTWSTPYLDALAAGVPADVPIAWTGSTVVCDRIGVDELGARAAALGGRAPFLWDNYPVNDAVMADRLFLGPLRGRDPGLLPRSSGYLANPMVQPRASTLPLSSVAAWLRGDDPDAAWAADADALGWRTFAEACDGVVPAALVDAVISSWDGPDRTAAVDRLHAWVKDASACTAPGLEDEAGPWLDQVHAEADLARTAVGLLRTVDVAPGDDLDRAAAVQRALAIGFVWASVVRAPVSVFGPRLSLRPVLTQWPDGEFAYRAESLQVGDNALDRLCRFALDRLAAATEERLPRA